MWELHLMSRSEYSFHAIKRVGGQTGQGMCTGAHWKRWKIHPVRINPASSGLMSHLNPNRVVVCQFPADTIVFRVGLLHLITLCPLLGDMNFRISHDNIRHAQFPEKGRVAGRGRMTVDVHLSCGLPPTENERLKFGADRYSESDEVIDT